MNLDRLRDTVARVFARTCSRARNGKALEVAADPDGPWLEVFADWDDEGATSNDYLLVDADVRTRVFRIPRQEVSGEVVFPPLNADDSEALFTVYKIRIKGQTQQWAVQSWKVSGNGAIYEFAAESYHANMVNLVK